MSKKHDSKRKVNQITNELVNENAVLNNALVNEETANVDEIENFFNNSETLKIIDSITTKETIKKTTGKKSFWKNEAKAKFSNVSNPRTKLRNLQLNFCSRVNACSIALSANKTEANKESFKIAINDLKNFYDENCEHENFKVISNKNDDTGKDISTIKKAIAILKIYYNIK